MVLKLKWCNLLFTILSICVLESVAEVYPEQLEALQKIDQKTLERIEEYIKEQVQEKINPKSDAVTKSEYNAERDIADIMDRTISQFATDVKQITDKANSANREKQILKSIEEINNKLDRLESIERAIDLLYSSVDQMPTSTNNDQENNDIVDIPSETDNSDDSNTDETRNTEDNIPEDPNNSLNRLFVKECYANVPSSVNAKPDIWRETNTPLIDDLDTYMNTTLGCKYESVPIRKSFYITIPNTASSGKPVEQHFYIRTDSLAVIRVWWKPITPAQYRFEIGDNNNTIFKESSPYPSLDKIVTTIPTPGILSADKYTQFYVKIDKETLSFGRICFSVKIPLFTRKIPASTSKADTVVIRFDPYSYVGGKIVHSCPADTSA